MKLIRITTSSLSLNTLLNGQMKYMSENGFETIMISNNDSNIQKLKTIEKSRHIIVPMKRKISLISDFFCLIKLVVIFIKEKPDIIHTHTPKAGLLGMIAAKICLIKKRIHTVAGLPFVTSKGFKKTILFNSEKITYWASNFVLPNSYSNYEIIKKKKLCHKNKLLIIGKGSSNGVDLNRFSKKNLNKKTSIQLKKIIAYEKSLKYILFVGRLVKDKGIVELINAFCSIKMTKLKLIMVGAFEKNRKEENLPYDIIKLISNNPNIIHINGSNKIEYFMDIADLFVFPSHREGFPNVLLEAGAMKLPILCSKIPGNIDIIDQKYSNNLFQLNDVNSITNKIELFFDNKLYLNTDEIYKKIKKNYSRDLMHEKIFNFYKKLT